MEDLTFKTYEGLQHGWAAEELEDLAQCAPSFLLVPLSTTAY